MFSIGPSDPLAGLPSRIFPDNPSSFGSDWTSYYDAMSGLANNILSAFALELNLPENYFESYVTHHASAMRALNYPSLEGYELERGQLRASAHTDYGAITILRSDGPGLQVSKDLDTPVWYDVPYVEDGFIINLGDLMKRWTNDKWLSTLHRVVFALPEDICLADSTYAVVTVLNSESPKYPPIVAGDFLMQKHLASILN
eukprot:gene21469-27807_t